MSLRWKQFEKSMRPRLAAHDPLRQLPWWRQILRRLDQTKLDSGLLPLRVILSIGLWCFVPFAFISSHATSGSLLNFVAAYLLFGAICRTGAISVLPVSKPDYLTLWLLPLSENTIYRNVLKWLSVGTALLAIELVVAYSLIALQSQHAAAAFFGGLLCAMLQVALSLAISLLLLTFRAPNFVMAAVALGILVSILGEFAMSWNPFVWVNTFYRAVFIEGSRSFAIVPALVVIATLPWSIRRFRKLHRAFEYRKITIMVNGRAHIPRHETAAPRVTVDLEMLRTHASLQPLDWNAVGSVARILGRLLTTREKLLIEGIVGERFLWDRLIGFVVACVCGFLIVGSISDKISIDGFLGLSRNSTLIFSILIFVAAMVGLLLVALVFLQTISLFQHIRSPELNLHGLNPRLQPTNHWEIAVTRAKANFVCAMILLPLTVIVSLSPVAQIVEQHFHLTLANLPLAPLIIWIASFALSMPSQLLPNRKYFLLSDLILVPKLMAIGFVLFALVVAALFAPGYNLIFFFAFAGSSLGWFAYEARRYRLDRF